MQTPTSKVSSKKDNNQEDMSSESLDPADHLPPIYWSTFHKAWIELERRDVQAAKGLTRNEKIDIASWNIDAFGPVPTRRMRAIIQHLKKLWGPIPSRPVVILFQEVLKSAVQELMEDVWIRQHFFLVGIDPPRVFYRGVPSTSTYYTISLVFRAMWIDTAFRIPLPTGMNRDALFIDLPICAVEGQHAMGQLDVLRICNCQLESLALAADLRQTQLQMISHGLHGSDAKKNIVAGLVGGDMTAVEERENSMHAKFGLRDAWHMTAMEDQSTDKDETPGASAGHTWGYQPVDPRYSPARFDKFFYIGCLTPHFGKGLRHTAKLVGRIGIGATTDILSDNDNNTKTAVSGVSKTSRATKSPTPDEQVAQNTTTPEVSEWVSYHFGITVAITLH